MPRMSGLEAVAAIRKSKREQQTDLQTEDRLIIFGVTGNALTEDVEEFKRAGCDEVLTKPLQLAALKGLFTSYDLN